MESERCFHWIVNFYASDYDSNSVASENQSYKLWQSKDTSVSCIKISYKKNYLLLNQKKKFFVASSFKLNADLK